MITTNNTAESSITSANQSSGQVINTLTLPAGTYLVMESGWAQGLGSGAAIRCGISIDDTGSGNSVGISLGASAEGSTSAQLPVTVAASTVVTFSCYNAGSATNYVRFLGSRLTAVATGLITSQ